MTNFEYLASNKHALATLLDSDDQPMWQKVNTWYCTTQCPHHVKKKYIYGEEIDSCRYDECVDKHTSMEVMLMWLDAEHEDI